jgi:plastocyanin
MRLAIRCIVVALALIVLAPAVAADEPGREPRGATQVVRVRIVDFAFRPRNLTIDRGTVVRWANRGNRRHTTTSNTGLWNHTLAPGETFRRRFRRMGSFAYHCSIHPQMTGTITVT